MNREAIKRIILTELELVEEDLTEEQRLHLAIEIAIRLLDQSIKQHT